MPMQSVSEVNRRNEIEFSVHRGVSGTTRFGGSFSFALTTTHRGVAKRPKAPVSKTGIRRFKSCRPCEHFRSRPRGKEREVHDEADGLMTRQQWKTTSVRETNLGVYSLRAAIATTDA